MFNAQESADPSDEIDHCLVYWACENYHMWSCRPGPNRFSWIFEYLDMSLTPEQRREAKPVTYTVNAAVPSTCPTCSKPMQKIEVMVNAKFNNTQYSEA